MTFHCRKYSTAPYPPSFYLICSVGINMECDDHRISNLNMPSACHFAGHMSETWSARLFKGQAGANQFFWREQGTY